MFCSGEVCKSWFLCLSRFRGSMVSTKHKLPGNSVRAALLKASRIVSLGLGGHWLKSGCQHRFGPSRDEHPSKASILGREIKDRSVVNYLNVNCNHLSDTRRSREHTERLTHH